MRLEAVAPFGAPLFTLVGTGNDGTLLLPRDRRVVEHGPPAEVMAAVAGVPLGANDMLRTLTAGESLKESRRDVRCERTGPGRQLGQLGGAGRRADRQKQNGTKAPTAHFLLSFCFAVRILRSISARSMESPSPASARVNATIASSRRPSFSSTSP